MALIPGALALAGMPPTAFALRTRPWLAVMFVLLLAVAMARLVFLDLAGAFLLVATAVAGWHALRDDMNIALLFCLAIVLCLNALFDALALFSFVISPGDSLFSAAYPWHVNAARALLLLGPPLELAAGVLCWQVHRDHLASFPPEHLLLLEEARHLQEAGYGSGARQPAAPPAGGCPVPLPTGAVGHKMPGPFRPFQGASCRL